ncbi:hypothetical protein, conserved [Babesia bigemina]|uniref:Uncharacterized protein n=1 Tax=Babesia bigemina TaxID=5866 RepID=A0A061D445_BABBI|nr:hypothetical protein, conserved [Babesia bigemina]CDR95338.1 hypothetical protein, conserved [Babesia bigemina]|eukprot:XP_012767524.1 hypothetical protein, conserved [Babesia bigemina]
MAAVALHGYKVKGVNNVVVRLYPQVLGIHKVHEHNLCNALRDFGLMLKSECVKRIKRSSCLYSRDELLQYNHDFLKFAHTMRSSELCMIAHGYSILELDDRDWWDKFSAIAARNSYDMDGKEMAGLMYSLSRVYPYKHPLISQLIEESTPWIQHANPGTLSLLVKVISNLKIGGNYLHRINKRAIEIISELNIVDVIFFITSNTDAKVRDLELYRALCTRSIELYDDMELHHVRALAASLSIGGYKSSLFFNVLSLRLVDICRTKKLKDGDVISLFLAYTSQKFLSQNDLCIDVQVYKRFLQERHGYISKDKFEFPIPELGPVFSKALSDNIHRITANGMPIVLRAISILKIPVDRELYSRVLQETAQYIRDGKYDGLKLSNLVVTIAKRPGRHDVFWNAVHDTLSKPDADFNADIVAKMTATLGAVTDDAPRRLVYKDLINLSLMCCKDMTVKSIFALTRVYAANMELEALCSEPYVNAVVALMQRVPVSDVFHLLKLYPFRVLPPGNRNVVHLLEAAKDALNKSHERSPGFTALRVMLEDFVYKQDAEDTTLKTPDT